MARFSEMSIPSMSTLKTVDADEPLTDLIPKLLESPSQRLDVVRKGKSIGYIDAVSLLEALGRMLPPRETGSDISIECAPADFSASAIARAVEDADAHLLDFWSEPVKSGRTGVHLRISHSNPEAAVRSLRRYGFDVREAYGHTTPDFSVEEERLSALQLFLNV